MKRQNRLIGAMAVVAAAAIAVNVSACSHKNTPESMNPEVKSEDMRRGKPGGPQLGTPGGGPVIDKTGDTVLQSMIKEVVPRFKQMEYKDSITGKTLMYNLLVPKDMEVAKDYPLVLFMADASTPGSDATRPLTQGYGALVWGTDSWQQKHPCYVLVPQFSGVAVNDAYEHTDEVDIVARLVMSIAKTENVDKKRLYTTGQSMGGMISMYYNSAYPDLFAASIFVDCHWDSATFPELVKHKFAFITAGKAGTFGALEEAASDAGIKYAYTEFSARLPQAEQNELVSRLLAKGDPINIINFESKTVVPPDGKGSEHMYSFDYAYRLTPVREWLFRQ